MLEQISNSVFRWIEMHGESRGMPYTWNSYAVHCPEDDVLALIDPLEMSEEEAQELEEMCRPTHILLTCAYHVREALAYRERWGCQIWANNAEASWYEIDLDGYFEDGQRLWDKIDLIYVPDWKFQETAFLIQDETAVLLVGDLFGGGRQDTGTQDEEMSLGGPKYVHDLKKARMAMQKLLPLNFGVLCFAHGTPVRKNAVGKMKSLLNDNALWDRLQREKDIATLTDEDKADFALRRSLVEGADEYRRENRASSA